MLLQKKSGGKVGKVYLVGAGPSDESLLTVRGKECLEKADCVLYDRLSSNLLLRLTQAECIDVGKKPDFHRYKQHEINELLYEKSKQFEHVVRLKAGDPFVFGRGQEEAEYLIERGVEVEVVPGITSAIAGPALAGIPVTSRKNARSFHVITGHLKEDEYRDFSVYAKLDGTLILMMAIKHIEQITAQLIEGGLDKNTPAAAIMWATRSYQKTCISTLENLAKDIREQEIKAPSIIVIGDVVEHEKVLFSTKEKPLKGKRFMVLRSAVESELDRELSELGAEVHHYPILQMKTTVSKDVFEEKIRNLERFEGIIFSSKQSVRFFMDLLDQSSLDIRSISCPILALGQATSRELNKYHLKADQVATKETSDGVFDLLKEEKQYFYPTSALADNALTKANNVESFFHYTTLADSRYIDEIKKEVDTMDGIVFMSSSTVNFFFDEVGSISREIICYSMGEKTSASLRKYGAENIVEIEKPRIQEMIKAIVGRNYDS